MSAQLPLRWVKTLEPWVPNFFGTLNERKFAQTKLANALISKFRLSSNEGRRPCKYCTMNFYSLYEGLNNYFLTKHKAMQPRTFGKSFRASMGQRRFNLLFTCHCPPRTLSIKRRFQFATVVHFGLLHKKPIAAHRPRVLVATGNPQTTGFPSTNLRVDRGDKACV